MLTIITNIQGLKMKEATIKRIYLSDCTLGVIEFGNQRAYTLELPWKGNVANKSCIPTGVYYAKHRNSPSNGDVIELQNVPERSYIQIHSGNYTSQIKGCILVGDSIRDINGDSIPDVTNSKATLKKFLEWAGDDVILIKIQ